VHKEHIDPSAQSTAYYLRSRRLYEAFLSGHRHFAYTEAGARFRRLHDLLAMERRLGETIGLPAGSHVLDAGSGTGRVAVTLAGRPFSYRITGVDLVPVHVQAAQAFARRRLGHAAPEFVIGDYSALPFPAATFDAVYTMETLVHANPLSAALAEFYRVLKPGGRLVHFEYSIPSHEQAAPEVARAFHMVVELTGMASLPAFGHGALPRLLGAAGFEDVHVEDITARVWPSWRWLHHIAITPYRLMQLTGTDHLHPDATAAVWTWRQREQMGYNIVTARKASTLDG
jgi:sterol 24-C-methyltransferase